jgi:hypothetical protein
MTSVVLITIDGIRRKDIFNGLDPYILNMIGDNNIKKKCIERFSNGNITPFINSKQLSKRKLIEKNVKIKNGVYVSYPGYNELLTGRVNKKIKDNDYLQNNTMTFMEKAIRKKIISKDEAIMSSTWYKMDDIYASTRSGIIGQKTLFSIKNPLQLPLKNIYPQINKLDPQYVCPKYIAKNTRLFYNNEQHDIETYRAFINAYYSKISQGFIPKAMHLALGLTDLCAHNNNYYEYLNHLHLADGIIKHLYKTISPNYIIITTDHGRGENEYWEDHGTNIPGSEYSWCIVLCSKKYKKIPKYIKNNMPKKLGDISKLLGIILNKNKI